MLYEVFGVQCPPFQSCYSTTVAQAGVARLVGASSHKVKGCEFDSQSRHIPRLQHIQVTTNWCFSHQCLSLSTSLPLCLKPISMSLAEDKKRRSLCSQLVQTVKSFFFSLTNILCGTWKWLTSKMLPYISQPLPLYSAMIQP